MTDETARRLRDLPSVERLARAVAREELAHRRREILREDGATVPRDDPGPACENRDGADRGSHREADLVDGARARLQRSMRRVLNATGVIVHTNLGRAPLAAEACAAVTAAAQGYSNLELDLVSGERSRRGKPVESLLVELTGAQDALVVNNGAAAVLLAVSALAGPGGEVIVSRGELLEIGGGFRIPDVIRQSGAALIEVGTTNRTRAGDYAAALSERTGAILRVHQSNFQMRGFVERPPLAELAALGAPVIDDLGSGVLARELPVLADEPTAQESLREGATLVCFSADKLLGGPQAGIMVGAAPAVAACRASPLARALRVDKLCLAGLEATLALYRDPALARRAIPVLAMLDQDPEELQRRTRRLARATGGELVQAVARVGGGALPMLELTGPAVALDPMPAHPAHPLAGPEALAARLRAGDPALLARIHAGRVLLDARTLSDTEAAAAAECVARALSRAGS